MFKFRLLIFVTIFSLFFDATLNYASANGLPVFVSILPQKYFVQQIGRDMVNVRVMVQPGASPATYEPKPRQMADLSKTKIYFSIGVPFEKVWLNRILSTNSKTIKQMIDQKITSAAKFSNLKIIWVDE